MISPLSTRAAAAILLLANAPAMAQEGQQLEPARAQVAVAEQALIPAAGVPLRSETIRVEPPQPDSSWLANGARAWSFVHITTVQPAMELARSSGEWISTASSAAGDAAQSASQWLAANASTVVITAQDTGQWVVSISSSAANVAIDSASKTLSVISPLNDWSASLVKQVEDHLRADGNSEFAQLLKESGFVLANIKVEVGLLPELAVEFRHERSLTPEELAAFKAKVNDYVKKSSGVVAYFEGILLGRLSRAGEYTGGMRISEMHIDVFPLPGMKVFFDPFRFEEEQNQMLVDAYQMAEKDDKTLKALKERLAKLEALVANIKPGK